MNYEKAILTRLMDSYENRDTGSHRQITVDIPKKYPAYKDPFDPAQPQIDAALVRLTGWGFITGPRSQQGYFQKVTLSEDQVDAIYDYLHRQPKDRIRQMQQMLLDETANRTQGITRRICMAFSAALAQKKTLSYGIGSDTNALRDILLILEKLESLQTETYIRNFSEMVFHDSKRFQHYQNTIRRLLLDFGDEPDTEETVLATHNLLSNPTYIYVKGCLRLGWDGQTIDLAGLPGGIALSSLSLSALRHVEAVPSAPIVSVENLTTYHDTPVAQGVVLYLGGFVNSVRACFLQRLFASSPQNPYYHKGDLDPYGFLILENLKARTAIPFQPLEMDLDTLRTCYEAGHYRPLTPADKKAMESPYLAPYGDILDFMRRYDCKIEQECFAAMALEQQLRTDPGSAPSEG